jgi:hypothetical protein
VRSAHSVISVRPRLRRISAAWAGVNNCGRSSAARSTAVNSGTPHGQRSGSDRVRTWAVRERGRPSPGRQWPPERFLNILFKLVLLLMSTAEMWTSGHPRGQHATYDRGGCASYRRVGRQQLGAGQGCLARSCQPWAAGPELDGGGRNPLPTTVTS